MLKMRHYLSAVIFRLALAGAGISAMATVGVAVAAVGDPEWAVEAVEPHEIEDLGALPGLPQWDFGFGLRVAAGYKDNVLLTDRTAAAESSVLLRAELEVFGWRLPQGDSLVDWTLLLTGIETTYPGVDGDGREERVWLAQAEVRYGFGDAFHLRSAVQGYWQDQVLDLSSLEAEGLRQRLQVGGVAAQAGGRWEFRPPWWTEAEVRAKRDTFRAVREDHDEWGGGARLGRHFADRRQALSLGATARRRDYAERNQVTVGGRPLPGTRLTFDQSEVEARLVSEWGRQRHWTSTLRSGLLRNRDNGTGFYDFDTTRHGAKLVWSSAPWRLEVDVQHRRYTYLVQLAGTGFDPPPRRRQDTFGLLRLERRWNRSLGFFAEFGHDRSRSNDLAGDYDATTLFGGFSWER
jgi:hypothetical protein